MADKRALVQQAHGPRAMGYRVKVLSMLLGRSLQQSLEPYDLTPFHWLVLNCLWREDGLPVSTIGDKLQQVGGTMTGVLDRMEIRGLIVRERDLDDRRVWRIWLTAKAKDLGKTLPPVIRQSRAKLYEGISQSDYDTFMSVLEQLIDKAAVLVEETKSSTTA